MKPDSPIVMRQTWRHLLFLHWKYSPETIAASLPEGLEPDLYRGDAWVGIVPFFMQRVRPRFCPAVPGLSDFLELNLRTYVRHSASGKCGVWFYSLDCDQALATTIARALFHLPYEHATMSAEINDGTIHYISRRKGQDESDTYRYPANLAATRSASPGSLEHFLLERYHLISRRRSGKYYVGQVHHEPYRFTEVEADFSTSALWELAGLPTPSAPPASILAADPVDVTIHPLQRL